MTSSIRYFFLQAYNASPSVVSRIRIVSSISYSREDRGLRYDVNIKNVLQGFCQFLNGEENRREFCDTGPDHWSFIRPEMVYLFDASPENLEVARSGGFTAVNSGKPDFFNYLMILASAIRSEKYFKGISDMSYGGLDGAAALEENDWAVVNGPLLPF